MFLVLSILSRQLLSVSGKACVVLFALLTSACSKTDSPGNGETLLAPNNENIQGRWKLSSASQAGRNLQWKGTQVVEFKAGGKYVAFSAGMKFDTAEEECTALAYGQYAVSASNNIDTTPERRIGRSGCLSDQPSQPLITALSAQRLVVSVDGQTQTFLKESGKRELIVDELRSQFENVTLAIQDPEAPGLNFTYRNPVQGGFKQLCVTFASATLTTGFVSTPTFFLGNAVYETWLQFEEGVINPLNYSGPAPAFIFRKRDARSSDLLSYSGTGIYTCSSLASCTNKCRLTFSNYSKASRKASFELVCDELGASSGSDTDNLFGAAAKALQLSVSCNYHPDLSSFL